MNSVAKQHVILGAGGTIGRVLAKQLVSEGDTVVLVSRRGTQQEGCQSVQADLSDTKLIKQILCNSPSGSVAYLVAGVVYDNSKWEKEWPLIINSVTDACSESHTPLIFLDNVYLYGRVEEKDLPMTENTAINPISRKGAVRSKMYLQIKNAFDTGKLQGTVIRSADFYGPECIGYNSPINGMFLDPLIKGKSSTTWMGSESVPHSFTFTLDLAKCLSYAGKNQTLWRQPVWHASTSSQSWTGKIWWEKTCELLGKRKQDVSVSELGFYKMSFFGLFNSSAQAVSEMMYQFIYPYLFSSSTFEKETGILPTPYEQGLKQTIEWMQSQSK